MRTFSIAIHGGAGTLVRRQMTLDTEKVYKAALAHALDAGYNVLQSRGTATDAVEAAVRILEDSPLFNAGKGSVFTAEGLHEMDASIMDGKTQTAGAISLVRGIKNPISLARDVMEKSEHVFLAGEGAMQFARSLGYTFEEESYFYDALRYQQWQDLKDTPNFSLDHSNTRDSKFGTVGAVACDSNGNIAAATSTGGMTNKRYGRIGDSSVIGSGTYANNDTCAVSCTGSGEYFIRGVVAYDIACYMEHKGACLNEAAHWGIHERLQKLGGDGGLIAVDSMANIAMPFNTEGMYRGYMSSTGNREILIFSD
jgi:beta-aspartyl-peptidase (threonine type)